MLYNFCPQFFIVLSPPINVPARKGDLSFKGLVPVLSAWSVVLCRRPLTPCHWCCCGGCIVFLHYSAIARNSVFITIRYLFQNCLKVQINKTFSMGLGSFQIDVLKFSFRFQSFLFSEHNNFVLHIFKLNFDNSWLAFAFSRPLSLKTRTFVRPSPS